MIDILLQIAFLLYLAASAGLLVYGLNCYLMLALHARRHRRELTRRREREQRWRERLDPARLPTLTTQLPIFNERHVAERVIRAVAAFDHPRDRHQIQVLDDSTDETRGRIETLVAELQAAGHWIELHHRRDRHGFKAGALQDAMPAARGDFIAIFDADFAPPPDFPRRLLPHFDDPRTGLVQARWGHLNRERSLLTRAQSMGIDGHFAIEQSARCSNHLFLNFNGTAGIWRRDCVLDAGGWTADTLTEDLDLSYRAQLRGWRIEYVPEVVVPAELPTTYSAFKSQQFRWAKGSIQTARKLLPQVFASARPPLAKAQAVFHLGHYLAHPLMLAVALLALPSLAHLGGTLDLGWLTLLAIPLLAATFGPTCLYATSQHLLHRDDWWRRVLLLPGLVLVGFGICISNTRAVLEALLGIRSGFVRTPKSGDATRPAYRCPPSRIPWLEVAASLYCAITLIAYFRAGNYAILPFLALYVSGFALVGFASLREQSRAPS